MNDFLYGATATTMGAYFRLFRQFRVRGKENVPAGGPLIAVANHVHNLDPVVLGTAFPRKIFFMAKKELFNSKVVSFFLKGVGAFPVKRGRADLEAMRKAIRILKEEQVLGLFPEGTRNKHGQFGKAQSGIVMLALKTQAPIIPCGLVHTHTAKEPLIVQIGQPFELNKYYGRKLTKAEMAEVGVLIMDQIAREFEKGQEFCKNIKKR